MRRTRDRNGQSQAWLLWNHTPETRTCSLCRRGPCGRSPTPKRAWHLRSAAFGVLLQIRDKPLDPRPATRPTNPNGNLWNVGRGWRKGLPDAVRRR